MRQVLKLITFVTIALSLNAVTGCTDFPDEYGIDAQIEIIGQGDVTLSDDGKSIISSIIVNYQISKNTYKKISSAIVTVNGENIDVTDQINPNKGGEVKVPYTTGYNNDAEFVATIDIYGHVKEVRGKIWNNDLTYLSNISTGKADNLTPCSATLYADAKYPWLVSGKDLYMVVSKENFNVPQGTNIKDFEKYGDIAVNFNSCYIRDTQIISTVNVLEPNTQYYYQLVQLKPKDFYSTYDVILASDTKSFKTEESTAKLSVKCDDLFYNYLAFNVSLDKGNTESVISQSGISLATVKLYVGSSETNMTLAKTENAYSRNEFSFNQVNLSENTKYYYKFDYYAGDRLLASTGTKTITTIKTSDAKENGYEWVSLGLPSGLHWATMNIGADRAEKAGNYYAWGETIPKSNYSWSTYKWCNGTESTITKYTHEGDILESEDDAAHCNWGGKWRMATHEEWRELYKNCSWSYTTQNGVTGYKIVSKVNGNSIFLPETGYYRNTSFYKDRIYYWTSKLYSKILLSAKHEDPV